jgi:glyoxylase-like metal-dependent hydrolase (beta-lactamase superfamily II)
MSDVRLYMFTAGTLRCKVHNIKLNQGLGEPYEIPVPWYLITHPKGNVVIDGGTAVECATNPRVHWGDAVDIYWPVLQEQQGCLNQLRQIGVAPESVRFVLQSHLHLDHTGAVGRFPNATHLVQRAEFQYAFTPDWFASLGYIRKDFDKPGLRWQFLEGEASDFYDLYGDGSIVLIWTPGHSPGHQSLLITLPRSGPVLLTIDAAYTMDHWEEKALPGFLVSTVDAVRSVQKLRALADKTDAMVVTGHDPDSWTRFQHAPAFYD